MASQTSQNASQQAGELSGQAQLKRDEIVSDQGSHGNPDQSSDQNSSYASQATTFLQQTGESVKNIAQGAADAVKNTLGMNSDNSSNAPGAAAAGSNNPSSGPAGAAGSNNPSSGPAGAAGPTAGSNNPAAGNAAAAGGISHPSSGPGSNHPSNPSS